MAINGQLIDCVICLCRQVRRHDTGEIVTGPAAAQMGRTVDGTPTEVPGDVLVGGNQWLETGEFLDEESFARYRKQGGLVYGHWSDEQEVCLGTAIAHPLVMIASDGIPFVDGQAHPRGAGTFARVLGLVSRNALELVCGSTRLRSRLCV